MSRKDHEWHVALNQYNQIGGEFRHWMYRAKEASREVGRLARLFRAEREGTLPKIHRQCSLSPAEPIPENKLTCCLGVVCNECPHLKAIRMAKLSEQDAYDAMAWTCVGHILEESATKHVDTSEGFILTTDDRMFWNNVYQSMAATDDDSK